MFLTLKGGSEMKKVGSILGEIQIDEYKFFSIFSP
jgi:hypothetical protein